jgi:hypothetical protein
MEIQRVAPRVVPGPALSLPARDLQNVGTCSTRWPQSLLLRRAECVRIQIAPALTRTPDRFFSLKQRARQRLLRTDTFECIGRPGAGAARACTDGEWRDLAEPHC